MSECAPNFINYVFEPAERPPMPNVRVTRIVDGLAFGHGDLSGQEDPGLLAVVDRTIHESNRIIVPIDADDSGETIDDDGCGDGRGVKTTFTHEKVFKKSLNREKVFGGAITMLAAIRIGSGDASGETVNEVFENAITTADEIDINFGGHISEKRAEGCCGCGAIDNFPEALLAILKYDDSIRGVLTVLGTDTENLDKSFGNFRDFVVNDLPKQTEYSGNIIMEKIIGKGKVVKELAGSHREKRIILNTVPGFTVNQGLIRQASGEKAQVFATDLARVDKIAEQSSGGDLDKKRMAVQSELIYTLAIAAVLTKGDLPVDMIESVESKVTDYAA